MNLSANKIVGFILKPASLGCLIFLASFFIRWIALNQTTFGNGWDSYFYAVQIKSILLDGKMKSPEWILFYPLLLAVNLLFGDPIVSVKVLGCLLAGGFSTLVYFFALKFCDRKEAALLFAAITFFSPELTYFTAQWPKNLSGVDLLLALLLAMAYDKKNLVIVLVIAGLLGHRMTAVLGIGCGAFWFYGKYISRRALIGTAIVLVAIISITLIFPGVISLKDYQRVQNLITTNPQFAAASFISTFGFHRISPLWLMELLVTCFAAIVLVVVELSTVHRKKSIMGLMISLLMLILWFPFFFWDVSGAAYRLFHVGVLLLPLILLFLLIRLEQNTTIFIVLTFAFCGLSFFSWKSYDAQKQDPPYSLYHRITDRTIDVIKGHEPELIIAHKSLAEFFTYYSGLDAMPWIPDYAIDENKLWRIAVLPYPKLFYYYTGQLPIELKNNYYYVQEKEWQKFLDSIRQNESADLVNAHLTWLNPHEVRPAFLRKKN